MESTQKPFVDSDTFHAKISYNSVATLQIPVDLFCDEHPDHPFYDMLRGNFLDVYFDYSSSEPQTAFYPGAPEEIEVMGIEIQIGSGFEYVLRNDIPQDLIDHLTNALYKE